MNKNMTSKVCNLKIEGNKCYYTLFGCSSDEFVQIINYKSWILNSWTEGRVRKYFMFIEKDRPDFKIMRSSIGFSPLMIRYLETLGYVINGKHEYKSSKIPIGNIYYNLWDFQKEAVTTWFVNGAYGIIKAPTGSGKTVAACEIISRLKVRTIICVHSSDLLVNVWFSNLVEQFSESVKSRIGVVGGGLTKKQRMSMRIVKSTSFDDNINKDIVIASSKTLINNLEKLSREKFGLVIVDEVHHYPSEQFKKVAGSIRAPYRLGLSATLVRPDGMSPAMYGLIGNVVYSISIRDLVKQGILVEPVFKTIVIDDVDTQNKIDNCGYDRLELSRFIKKESAKSVLKKDYIINLINGLHMNNKKFILYTDYVNPIDGVFTRDYYVKELSNIGVKVVGVSSEMDSNTREYIFNMLKSGEIEGLVFGKLGSEGVNIPDIDSVVMCNASKSTILYPQRVGRSMRKAGRGSSKKYAYIYEIVLNFDVELNWSDYNFYEYKTEGYKKEMVYINSN